jgi:hypothetical protein
MGALQGLRARAEQVLAARASCFAGTEQVRRADEQHP